MAYSTDLREKIVRAYDEGLGSQRAISERFGVSRSFVEKLLQRRRLTGEVAALPRGGGRKPLCGKSASWCFASSSRSPTPRSKNSAKRSSASGGCASAARP